MSAVVDSARSVSSLVIAALLLCAREFLRLFELPHPTVTQIIDATGATRSGAYQLKDALLALLPTLQRPLGRPAAAPPAVDNDTTVELLRAVLVYMRDHPGCVYGGGARRRYSDAFRAFVIELREQHPQLSTEMFAAAIMLPIGTLKDWLAAANTSVTGDAKRHDDRCGDGETAAGTCAERASTSAQIETVLAVWKTWHGSFVDFCDHLQRHWRLSFGRSLIAHILEVHGVRLPRRRPGRSPDEEALRGSFQTFFAGAQWVGDGSAINVVIDGELITLNLELMVDPYSGAFVGISIGDEEDSRAVIDAFDDGVQTTGSAPLAVLLDNKPSNHTDVVDEALGDTLRMRSTQGRPQNKAHVEGAFGLFEQSVPALELDVYGVSERELAKQLLELVAKTFARAGNHRSRPDRNGRSRAQLYRDSEPSEQQIADARAALEERMRKQQLARQTREARQDPVVRKILDEAFERLALSDPERHIRGAIARYPLDAIVDAIATFEGKRGAGTLPEGVDARYLLGIVRNLANQNEGREIAEALLRQRVAARDHALATLERVLDDARDAIADPYKLVSFAVDQALDSERRLDTLFWLDAAADVVGDLPDGDQAELFRHAARRIHAAFRVTYRERLDAVCIIASKLVPLA
jgi:hypothetical protein